MRSIEEYKNLIGRLELENSQHPVRYKFKLAMLSFVGVGYVVFMLLLALSMSVGLVALLIFSKNIWALKAVIKFVWIPFVLAIVMLKAMWVRFEPPEGEPISRKDAPKLFSLIDEVRIKAKAKKVHTVLLSHEFNAAVYQIPRLGLLGWPKRYLILGVPLMNLLSTEEFKSVLAHEFGHLSKDHMRFGNWIYRIRQLWMVLLERLEQMGGVVSVLFTKFFSWYSPYFNAYSFVLARSNEYEADREAAVITSESIAGSALTKVYTFANYMDSTYWGHTYDKVKAEEKPPRNAYSELIRSSSHIPNDLIEEELKGVLESKTDLHDTHPCLSDRLAGLNTRPKLEVAKKEKLAANELLGNSNQDLLNEFDKNWYMHVLEDWTQRHLYLKELKQLIAEHNKKGDIDTLSVEELWQYANAVDELDGIKSSKDIYLKLIEKDPEHASGNYIVGQLLLSEENDAGVELIEKSIKLDPSLDESAMQLLFEYFYYTKDDEQKAQQYYDKLGQYEKERQRADKERDNLHAGIEFEQLDMSADMIAAIKQSLKENKKVAKAWMARRIVKNLPQIPSYLVVVQIGSFVIDKNSAVQHVADAISELIPSGSVHVIPSKDNRAITKKIKQVRESKMV